MKKILLLSATAQEIQPTVDWLTEQSPNHANPFILREKCQLYSLVTGTGAVQSVYHLTRISAEHEFDLAMHVGVAGSFSRKYNPGDLVEIRSDAIALWGAQDNDGEHLSIFRLGYEQPDRYPFTNGRLVNPSEPQPDLPGVKGLSVGETSGTADRIAQLRERYSPDVETMESAGFFYVCLQNRIPFMSLRGISNIVEPRNRGDWKVDLAIKRLNDYIIQYLDNIASE
jgi:futalosine hydrolase